MKNILIIILLSLLANIGYSQDALFKYTYDIAFPIGETNDFIGKTSFLGFSLSGMRFIQPNIAIGGSFSWQVFNKRINDITQEFETEVNGIPVSGALTGDQFRYINSFPIHLTGYYVAGDESSKVRPYGALGLGMSVVSQRTEVGIFVVDDTNVHFSFAPEAGILIPAGYATYFVAGLKFPYAVKSGGGTSESYLTLNFGFANSF